MSSWEEEEEQIWECGGSDSVLERLRNQPIYSPPPSPTSVFVISPQLHFSLPPPITPQIPSVIRNLRSLRSLRFLPSLRSLRSLRFLQSLRSLRFLRSLFITNVTTPTGHIEELTVLGSHKFSFSARKDTRYLRVAMSKVAVDIGHVILKLDLWFQLYPKTQRVLTDIGEMGQCHSSKPLKRNLEDSPQDFGGALDVILKFLDEIPWWWRQQRLKLKSDRRSSLYVTIECEEKPGDFEEMTRTFVLESIPSGLFLPPRSPKMKDSSLVEERSVEITVEVDATNNGAHGVKAYENFPIVSHSEKKNTRDKLKRNYKSISVLTREDLEQHFGSSREDVANSFGVSVSTMKRICRKHGISRWPFQPERKKERLMEVISPSMHEKHDSRLRCIRTPLHTRSSPRTTAILDGGEMVQLDSSKQQSLVEFNVTNNSAHLVRASQSCSTVSHSDETNSRETLKRKCPTESALSFEDLQQHFGCKRDDAAKALGVSVSTVKRTCRQHGIPRWPSRKKKKVSKTDCILLEPQGEKVVSPTCSKMPTDGQTERGNEMVGHLQDQNEGPNLSNTENGSNEESITTLIFQDSVLVSEMDYILVEPEGEKNVSPTSKTPTVGTVLDFIEGPNLSNTKNRSNKESITTTFQDSVPVLERDCILLEPQGEKYVPPTHKTPTNGQTEVGNGMVGHIQDQNGIVAEFIEGPNLSNTENRSNEKSLTTPNFQDSVPGNYSAMDFSISSTYRESGEAGGSSELAFQPKELTPLTAYPNPNACVFTQLHISLREMLIENVGSSRDSKNFSTSALGFFMGAHVSESSCTMPLCSDQAPMQTMSTIPHIMPHLTEKQDVRTVTFKAQYREKNIKFRLSMPSGIVELKKQVTNRLGELGSFEVHYHDNDNDWILIGCDTDVWDCFELSSSSGNEVVRLLVRD